MIMLDVVNVSIERDVIDEDSQCEVYSDECFAGNWS